MFTATGIGTVINLDPAPVFSIADQQAIEGDNEVLVTVTKAGSTRVDAQVRVFTSDGSAQAGVDYQARNVILTFLPEETEKTVTIPLIPNDGNSNVEFNVTMTDPVDATLDPDNTTAVVSILEELFTVADGQANEGGVISFDVTVLEQAQAPITLVANTEDDTAIAGENYNAVVNETLLFVGPFPETQQVEVQTLDDDTFNRALTFNLNVTEQEPPV